MKIAVTTEPTDQLKRGFRQYVGDGELDDGTPVHMSMTENHLYLAVGEGAERKEERMDLGKFVNIWAEQMRKP